MNVHKTCQLKYIPTKIIKINADIFANFISLHFNFFIDIGEFLQEFKNADIIPVHKKKEKSDKTNYKPVSILSNLSWYGVSPSALYLIHSYLTNRTQRIKANNSFSRRSIMECGVRQGSVLGPLLFNIDLIDLFYECKGSNIANYADDTTPYTSGENIRAVISVLQSSAFRLFKWFENNHMKASPGKSHILLSNKKTEKVSIHDAVLTSSVD